jgi:hypothetical protein
VRTEEFQTLLTFGLLGSSGRLRAFVLPPQGTERPQSCDPTPRRQIMNTLLSRGRAWLIAGATATGIAIGAAGIAGAATNSSTSTASSSNSSSAAVQAPANPETLTHGPGETLLTGSTAARVKAAALKAVPGATVIRVETDNEGSPYEAHLAKADGTDVTVKVDTSFKVTAIESGFGGGPHGAPGAPAAPAAPNA